MNKKNLKKIIFCIFVIILGGIGGVLADRYFFPYLASSSWFSKYEFLRRTAENVTIINKTEQITIKEDTSISKISEQIISSVVNVISYSENNQARNATGTIVTSDGLVMVYGPSVYLENATYRIFVNENDSYEANFVGLDNFSNLVFLKIENGSLPSLPLADSNASRSGMKVVAIGNSDRAYSIRYSSAILGNFDPYFNLSGKIISSSEKMDGVFTSDFLSAKNLLGGPVVDYSGQVIGIIGSVQKNGQEVFFEIPSNQIKPVIDRAIRGELDQAPNLGIYYKPLSKVDALSENNLPEKV